MDSFGNGYDFEGYSIYRSRSERLDAFSLLGSYDRVDYDSMYFDSLKNRMVLGKIPPRTLNTLLDRAAQSAVDSFAVDSKPPYTPMVVPTDHGNPIFVPHGNNTGCYEDTSYTQSDYGNSAIDDTFQITSAIYDSTVATEDPATGDTLDVNYYSFTMDGILSSVPYYYSITSFDYGDPRTQLSPLESSKAINMRAVYAIDNFENSTGGVYVYPNPYILDGRYRAGDWEDVNLDQAYSQRVYFANLPEGDCIIRIFITTFRMSA